LLYQFRKISWCSLNSYVQDSIHVL